ncbi:hypothetical protein CF65_01247 [Aggregatibacter actinomycetemcomitans HK1651]|nr:hypothetical protein CF65_01247 [Aggregatibacter actinomycetemcomitans HK1651]
MDITTKILITAPYLNRITKLSTWDFVAYVMKREIIFISALITENNKIHFPFKKRSQKRPHFITKSAH